MSYKNASELGAFNPTYIEAATNAAAVVGLLHSHGIGHGDIHERNLIYDGKKTWVIDPMVEMSTRQEYLMRNDIKRLRSLGRNNRKLTGDIIDQYAVNALNSEHGKRLLDMLRY
jgi:tRNA A-37 threonylcarbamoyl transferase component Bud32